MSGLTSRAIASVLSITKEIDMAFEASALELSKGMIEDVHSLLHHHPASKQEGRGRPETVPGIRPLLRACIALCYTAWEVYVEEALRETVEYLIESRDPDDLPTSLQNWVTKEASNDPWAFTGERWKDEVRNRVALRLDGTGGKGGFNAANPDNVDKLYAQILGIEPLKSVSWQNFKNEDVLKTVALLVSVRGEIVHRGTTRGDVDINGVRDWVNFIERLCTQFERKLDAYRTGAVA